MKSNDSENEGSSPGVSEEVSERQCAFCSRLFRPTRVWNRFCSTECRASYHRDEDRAARAWARNRRRGTD
jgi:hypothetical protein